MHGTRSIEPQRAGALANHAIARGQATHASYTFAESQIRIGRSARPVDGLGKPRTNQVVFLEDGDDPVGVVLRSGDEIQVGTASLRIQI